VAKDDAGENRNARTAKVTPEQAMTHLRSALHRANAIAELLEPRVASSSAQLRRVIELEHQLRSAHDSAQEVTARLVDAEHHAERLMNLYVAAYQLHGSLDPDEVMAAIIEVAVNLVGAKRVALLLPAEGPGSWEVAISQDLDDAAAALFPGERHAPGAVPLVDAALTGGRIGIGASGTDAVAACIPLQVQGEVVGGLVLVELLEQRPPLDASDREMLALLGAHAGSALLAARSFADASRRLEALRSLMALARPVAARLR
jgi:nitrate/nitrite-specific signal transduction histidine kinase